MAASTSRAAALMSRFRSNCMVTLHAPSVLVDVISVTAAMWPNWRSSGVATDEAITSGLAPGRPEETEMVGKSTCGRGETGRSRKETAPASAIPTVSSVVATGLLMNRSEMLMRRPAREPAAQPVEPKINDWGGIESQCLADDQAADNGDAQRVAQLRSHARSKREGNTPEQRRHGCHRSEE